MAPKELITLLHQALADSYMTFLLLQNYHWNVEGEGFYSYHKLFEELYDQQLEANDEIAERIRALGEKVFEDVISIITTSSIKQLPSPYRAESSVTIMLENLRNATQQVINAFQKVKEAADRSGDDETVDLAVERITAHQKTLWMLTSSLVK